MLAKPYRGRCCTLTCTKCVLLICPMQLRIAAACGAVCSCKQCQCLHGHDCRRMRKTALKHGFASPHARRAFEPDWQLRNVDNVLDVDGPMVADGEQAAYVPIRIIFCLAA